MVPLLGGGVSHVGGVLIVLAGGGNSLGTAGNGQLGVGSGKFPYIIQGRQATNGEHAEDKSPNI